MPPKESKVLSSRREGEKGRQREREGAIERREERSRRGLKWGWGRVSGDCLQGLVYIEKREREEGSGRRGSPVSKREGDIYIHIDRVEKV